MIHRFVLLGLILLGASASSARAAFLAFDSLTGATTLTGTGSTPRTFIGGTFQIGGTGDTVNVTTVRAFPAYFGATQSFNNFRASFQLWGLASLATTGSTPAFSNPLTPVLNYDFGPTTLTTNTFLSLNLSGFNVPLSPGQNYGITFANFVDSGSGFVSNPALTSLLYVGGANPAIGSQPLNGYYRNASGETNYNFLGGSARNIGTPSGVVFQLEFTPAPVPPTALLGLLGVPVLGWIRRRRRA